MNIDQSKKIISEEYLLQIENIMDNFDFEKVHMMMKKLKWEWCDNGVPSVQQLRKTARGLLRELASGDSLSFGTGGFRASWNSIEPKRLYLSFYIADYEAYEDRWD